MEILEGQDEEILIDIRGNAGIIINSNSAEKIKVVNAFINGVELKDFENGIFVLLQIKTDN